MNLEDAKRIVGTLAAGIDPITGDDLPKDHVCNDVDVVRALYTLLHAPYKRVKNYDGWPDEGKKRWTKENDNILCEMFDEGVSNEAICGYFQRTVTSVAARLVRLGKIKTRDEFRYRGEKFFAHNPKSD